MKIINEDTLEIIDIEEQPMNDEFKTFAGKIEKLLPCDAKTLSDKYNAYKKAESEFKQLYDPFKKKLLELYKEEPDLMKAVILGDTKVTYVSPSIRSSVDVKKLKEELPDVAKKFIKTTSVDATLKIESYTDFTGIFM